MKIIFLDIDGVLVTVRAHFAYGKGIVTQSFDPVAVELIRRLCKEYDCKIVISSSWRHDEKNCKRTLSKHNLFKLLHDDWRTGKDSSHGRGKEIQEWLKRHTDIEKYIIIDDDSFDLLSEQKQFLIQTDSHEGILSKDYILAKKLLKEEQ